MSGELFTIGHSNHTIEVFIGLLKKYEITAVADVRSQPHSRYFPQFNTSELKTALDKVNIRYVFLGRELGGRSKTTGCYDLTGKTLAENIGTTSEFSEGIKRLLENSQTDKIALMCAERDPITCHRSILVCHHLRKQSIKIAHILPDGSLESHADFQERLLLAYGLQQLQQLDRSIPDASKSSENTEPSSKMSSVKKTNAE